MKYKKHTLRHSLCSYALSSADDVEGIVIVQHKTCAPETVQRDTFVASVSLAVSFHSSSECVECKYKRFERARARGERLGKGPGKSARDNKTLTHSKAARVFIISIPPHSVSPNQPCTAHTLYLSRPVCQTALFSEASACRRRPFLKARLRELPCLQRHH